MLINNPIAHSSVMIRLEDNVKSKYVYDPAMRYFGDKDLFLRLLYPSFETETPIKIHIIPDMLIEYFRHSDSVSLKISP